jgi:hypothetical protein
MNSDHKVPSKDATEIAGQSSLGRRLSVDNFNWNEAPPQYWGISGANNARRLCPQYGNVTQLKDAVGSTNYWDRYIKLDKHFSQGLTVIANYSYGRNLGWLGGSIYYPRMSYGPEVFDEAKGVTAIPYQTALISWAYELPFGKGKAFLNGGIGAKVFGNWSISGVLSLQGGVPFTVTASNDSLNRNSPPEQPGGRDWRSDGEQSEAEPLVQHGGVRAAGVWQDRELPRVPAGAGGPAVGPVGAQDDSDPGEAAV